MHSDSIFVYFSTVAELRSNCNISKSYTMDLVFSILSDFNWYFSNVAPSSIGQIKPGCASILINEAAVSQF